MSDLRVFGIRHHGPGSARRLLQALEQWQPDAVLIEFPADAKSELLQVGKFLLEPPVALVIYDQQDIQQAYYYPFARFSPEWQALQWAVHNRAAVDAIDLPITHQLALRKRPQLLTSKTDPQLQRDPLGEMATLAGYDDREQWWEITFEQTEDDFALFAAINELITELRKEGNTSSRETLLREAYMRKVLRKNIKGGYERIAVVCGAWHSPALLQWKQHKATADNQALRGLPKVKTNAAWIPWSYPRLARMSGYGAGVHSPAWYEMSFDYKREASIHWMVKATQLLREEGMDTSPAHAQEAVRLANTLAAMNGQIIPSLSDLKHAAQSTLCEGSAERLALIEQKLLLGEKVGIVPENATVVPLQKDLTKQLKSSRLTKYWGKVGEQWLKATKANPRGGLDLRSESDLLKSQLLNQLQILSINWGSQQQNSANALGAFKELWLLHWQPEFSLQVLEAAMWGNTVLEAADQKLRQQETDADIATLAKAVLLGLRAGLKDSVQVVVQQLQDRSALTRDVQELLAGLPSLIKIIQYGDARKTDVTALALLVEEVAPRLATSLPGAAMSLDEEAAQLLLRDFLATHRGLCQLELPLLDDHWWPAVQKLADIPGIAPLLKGLATRLLFDQERIDLIDTARRLDYALSPGNEPLEVANWLAGFLNGSGLVLLHHPPLWDLVDRWVAQLDMDHLQGILPLLRRTFSSFSPNERQRMLERVKEPPIEIENTPDKAVAIPVVNDDLAEQLLADLDTWIKG